MLRKITHNEAHVQISRRNEEVISVGYVVAYHVRRNVAHHGHIGNFQIYACKFFNLTIKFF